MFLTSQSKSSKGKRRLGQRGQSTLEFVVIFPMLFLMFSLMLDFGWLLKNWIVVTNAAREATRCAAAHSCSADLDNDGDFEATNPKVIACTRISQGLGGNLTGKDVSIAYPGAAVAGDAIQITVSADNKFFAGLAGILSWLSGGSVLPDPFPLKARETMKLELDPDATWPTGAC